MTVSAGQIQLTPSCVIEVLAFFIRSQRFARKSGQLCNHLRARLEIPAPAADLRDGRLYARGATGDLLREPSALPHELLTMRGARAGSQFWPLLSQGASTH